MVYRLRNKFIRIMALSFLAVLTVLFLAMYGMTSVQTNQTLDMFADLISANGGFFPRFEDRTANFEARPFGPKRINPEAVYSTRFFTVQFDGRGHFARANVSSIRSITETEAIDYAREALNQRKERGWMGDYRYKSYETEFGPAAVFVNGADTKAMSRTFLLTAAGVFAGSSIIVLVLVVIFSNRAVRPVAESYERQKQFVTDASHELKTPLTLIRTDLELAEEELGKNEWLRDIRDASEGMTELVEKLLTLARMDEEGEKLEVLFFDLSEAVSDTAGAFKQLAARKGLRLHIDIPAGISYMGNEALLRQLTSILLDNAAKYCDKDGEIKIALSGGKHPILMVDNTFCYVEEVDLKRLFDRFYRWDKARTAGSGSGIGLSIAQAIVEKHHGQIEAQKKAVERFVFGCGYRRYFMKKRICLLGIGCLLLIALLAGCGAKDADAENSGSENLTADVLKIGKADTAIFQCGGHCMIIDCGEEDDGEEIIDFLENVGVDTVDLLILTHFDKDHIGGAPKLLEEKTVRQIYAPDYEGDGKAYSRLTEALEKEKLSMDRVTDAVELEFGNGKVRVMPSGLSALELENFREEIDNNMSLVTLITYGENKLLFTGDLEEEGTYSFLGREAVGHVDLLKIPHHGRYHGASEAMLDALSPKQAVICCSDKNPAQEAMLDALSERSILVYETRKGDIHIESDGRNLVVRQP